jgi:hypothetical protein
MKVRKSAVTPWVLVLLGMVVVSGCGPVIIVETPTPVASQPTPDATATYVAIATEIAFAPAMATDMLVVTIEAENCGEEEGCRLEGFWKPWATSGASNGMLINNEASAGQGADLKLLLTFQGTGVVIVYRQDTWYGTLRVEIDDQVGSINQLGVVKDQAEVCFKVGDSGNHTLTLSGSKGEGVITVDAIRVLCGDAPC